MLTLSTCLSLLAGSSRSVARAILPHGDHISHKLFTMCCRGKPANTATIVSYTLGFTAATLTAGLAYFYAKKALRKIEQRASQSEVDVPPGVLLMVDDARHPKPPNSGPDQESSYEAELSGQAQSLLLQQHSSNSEPDSPVMSDSVSPSQHSTLLQHTQHTADVENG